MWRWGFGPGLSLGLLVAAGSALDVWGYTHDIGPFALLLADGGNAWAFAVIGLVVVAAVASVVGERRFWPGVGAGTLVALITMITYLVMLSTVSQSARSPPYIALGDYVWWMLIFFGLPVVAAAALAAFVSGMALLALRLTPRLVERPVGRPHAPSP
jgi:hypothetical protein